jgi:DNA-binding transcriptional ArsR family regulator
MGDRVAKDALYAEFAAVGKVLGSAKRLELLDLLAQGPRSVEGLAAAADLGMSTCSAHLQTLREAGLVGTRREGKRVYYSLAGDLNGQSGCVAAELSLLLFLKHCY